jgi:hypothetical protein
MYHYQFHRHQPILRQYQVYCGNRSPINAETSGGNVLPIFALLAIAFGISQIIVGFLGIEYHLGTAAAALVTSIALVFRCIQLESG